MTKENRSPRPQRDAVSKHDGQHGTQEVRDDVGILSSHQNHVPRPERSLGDVRGGYELASVRERGECSRDQGRHGCDQKPSIATEPDH